MFREQFPHWARELSDEDLARAVLAAGLISEKPLAWSQPPAGIDVASAQQRAPRWIWSERLAKTTYKQSKDSPCSIWARKTDTFDSISLLLRFSTPTLWDSRIEAHRLLVALRCVRGATIECAKDWADATPWRLPITIGALEDDEAGAWFAEQNRWVPPHWPFAYRIVNRQFDRVPMLAVNATLADAETLFEHAPPRLKANAVIVNGLGTAEALQNYAAFYDALYRIATRCSAAGIVVLKAPLASVDFARSIHRTAMELTQNLAFDAALFEAFGDNAVLIGNASLLREARVATQLKSLTSQLSRLSKSAPLKLSQRSAQMLSARAPMAMSAPPEAAEAVSVVNTTLRSAMRKSAPGFGFVGESHEASALTELADAVREAASVEATAAASARRVQQQSAVRNTEAEAFSKVSNGFAVGETVEMRIRIGSASDPEWQSSDATFPDHELPKNDSEHRLTVMLHEPSYIDVPVLRDIVLPTTGNSDEAVFTFLPKVAGNFEARASVLHRGRVLQTALIRAVIAESRSALTPDHSIEVVDEARVRSDWTGLYARARFDLAFVYNRDDEHVPRLTGVSDDVAWTLDLGRVEASVKRISGLLSDAASHVVDHSDGLDQGDNPELLSKLAFSGRELFLNLLHEQIRNRAAGSLDLRSDSVSHIQIVGTRIDELVPIEFIYDYPLSAFEVEPAVCPKHREALERGECPAECATRRAEGEHICPMGFWGVRKVIERHLFDGTQAGREATLVASSEANAAHETLSIRMHALIGRSNNVAAATLQPLIDHLNAALPERVTVAEKWKDWVNAIETHAPSWLIAFPHNDGTGAERKLELGGQKIRTTAFPVHDAQASSPDASADYFVRLPGRPAPLVFLLGCDTSGALDDSGSHLDAFRRSGAAVIISTVATVFGEHAVVVGESLARALLDISADAAGDQKNAKRMGEVLRAAKRKALLESLPMALGIVAFGDADWRIV
ncbi:MAG: hypothetical protein EAZ24_05080 [Burkholderiales bacterium]|nr:MAG: hypothetical protein EAZ24_05080 [Burkholderiales bacterium]TAG82479.1 MAG: hypothetical protein EAZ21_03505 [Betaproteobacteria bacterium]